MPIRIQRKRTKGWRMPENTVYVARGSAWGNPYKVGRIVDTPYGTVKVKDNAHAISLFESYCISYKPANSGLVKKMNVFINGRHKIEYLHGKNLACWCSLDKPCHADILLEIANNQPSN